MEKHRKQSNNRELHYDRIQWLPCCLAVPCVKWYLQNLIHISHDNIRDCLWQRVSWVGVSGCVRACVCVLIYVHFDVLLCLIVWLSALQISVHSHDWTSCKTIIWIFQNFYPTHYILFWHQCCYFTIWDQEYDIYIEKWKVNMLTQTKSWQNKFQTVDHFEFFNISNCPKSSHPPGYHYILIYPIHEK